MKTKLYLKLLCSCLAIVAYVIGAASCAQNPYAGAYGGNPFLSQYGSAGIPAPPNPFQPQFDFTMKTPSVPTTMPVVASTPVVTSTPVSTGTGGSSTSSRTSSQTSSRACGNCKYGNTGRYECPCSGVATFGQTSYHNCSNCGQNHMRGSYHSCTCNKCGGKGYIR